MLGLCQLLVQTPGKDMCLHTWQPPAVPCRELTVCTACIANVSTLWRHAANITLWRGALTPELVMTLGYFCASTNCACLPVYNASPSKQGLFSFDRHSREVRPGGLMLHCQQQGQLLPSGRACATHPPGSPGRVGQCTLRLLLWFLL